LIFYDSIIFLGWKKKSSDFFLCSSSTHEYLFFWSILEEKKFGFSEKNSIFSSSTEKDLRKLFSYSGNQICFFGCCLLNEALFSPVFSRLFFRLFRD